MVTPINCKYLLYVFLLKYEMLLNNYKRKNFFFCKKFNCVKILLMPEKAMVRFEP